MSDVKPAVDVVESTPASPPPPPDTPPKNPSGDPESGEASGAPSGGGDPAGIAPQLEAALLTADRAISSGKLGEVLGGAQGAAVNAAITWLNDQYEQTGRSFRIEAVAGGWRMMTLPQYAGVLESLAKKRQDNKLSPAAMETLAIIAYKQPVLRADIEAVRGVACGEVLKSLMERQLIRIVGRAEEIGRPMLYGTTTTFLEVFGLSSVKDLPRADEFKLQQAKS